MINELVDRLYKLVILANMPWLTRVCNNVILSSVSTAVTRIN